MPSGIPAGGADARKAQALWRRFDLMLVPTAPTHYTIAEVQADPVTLNSRLGTWTNFVNLLDWSAISVPATLRNDGLPFGITFIAPAWHEAELLEAGRRFASIAPMPLGATGLPRPAEPVPAPPANAPQGCVRVAVVGAHLRGMPLNHQLTHRDARFVAETRTSPEYRPLRAGRHRAGQARVDGSADGASIIVELWDIPLPRFGEFVAEIPAPLGIGTLTLADGTQVKGFLCAAHRARGRAGHHAPRWLASLPSLCLIHSSRSTH
jgi:allophanate hydrolase